MRPYHPPKLPTKLDYSVFAKELAKACFELGKLDLQRKLPNPRLLIAPLTLKEATVSSKIEGTRSTVADVARYEAGLVGKFSDVVEVSNYRQAMLWSIRALKDRNINIGFIKDLHGILLRGFVRGSIKRGKFRDEQVFIGKEGDTIRQASFIPPEPIFIQEYMENLQDFVLGQKRGEDELVRAALIHYQFEAIHPFSDGNGRIGRLIIPLYLYKKGLLFQPILYLSGYFEKNRNRYVATLHRVDAEKRYEQWVKFFLFAVRNQAVETRKIVDKIEKLMNNTEHRSSSYMSPYNHKFIKFIFARPIFKSRDLMLDLGTDRSTALRIIKKYTELKIITKANIRESKKYYYAFEGLLKIL